MPMYEEHFGLSEAPFSIAPDPRYLFMSDQHREALAHLLYGVQSDGGFVLLTGEVGTGKTTICRCLLDQLPEDCVVAFVINPRLTARELLSSVCDELGIRYPRDNKSVKVFVDLLNAFLLDAHAKGRRAVLIIDEAQNLSEDVLEQIRLLTNLETNKRKLLQIILLGQPELREKLARPELLQLSQRIIARYHLGPLTKEEVGLYVDHRLRTAGSRARLFSPSAIARVYARSRGIPRLVNTICDRALLGAYARGKGSVDRSMVAQAAREVLGPKQPDANGSKAFSWYLPIGIALCVVVAAVAAARYHGVNLRSFTEKPAFLAGADQGTAGLHRRPIPQATGLDETDQPSPAASTESEPPQQMGPNPGGPALEAEMMPQEPPPVREGEPSSVERPEEGSPAPATKEGLAELARSGGEGSAYRALFKLWGAAFDPGAGEACLQAEAQDLRCFSGEGGLDELRKWNRPAVLKLTDAGGGAFFVALAALDEGSATFAVGGQMVKLQTDEVLDGWSGAYTLLWRPPTEFRRDLRMGRRSPTVAWLKSELARRHGEAVDPHPDTVFDGALNEEVKKFQLANRLKPDGIVGPQTLILLMTEADSGAPVLIREKKEP